MITPSVAPIALSCNAGHFFAWYLMPVVHGKSCKTRASQSLAAWPVGRRWSLENHPLTMEPERPQVSTWCIPYHSVFRT